MTHPNAIAHVIAILSQKGGAGKTTLAVNLAAASHLAGRRTLLLDQDPQQSALDWHAVPRAKGSKLVGLDVKPWEAALTIPKLAEFSAGYHTVIIDGPPRLGDVTRAAAVVASLVLVPFRAGFFDDAAGLETVKLLDAADTIRGKITPKRPPVRRLWILNAHDTRSPRLGEEALHAMKGDGHELGPIVGQRVAFQRALFSGESVLTLAEATPASQDEIAALYAAVTGLAAKRAA